MNPRKIREDLGRVRTCLQRRDLARAVYLLCLSLKDLGSQAAPLDLRGDFRTAMADICANQEYKKDNAKPVVYQPGREKEALAFFRGYYSRLTGEPDEEEYEQALQRKLNLDKCINNGKAFINQGKFSEADECFAEALKFYRNEIMAFGMMARAMMDAGEYVRGLGYVRKGLKEAPENIDLRKLGEECQRMRNQKG